MILPPLHPIGISDARTRTKRKRRGFAPRPADYWLPATDYCTTKLTACACAVGPSAAVTVTWYPGAGCGTVAGLRLTVAVALLLESACEVAVIVTVEGSPPAIVGAVYFPAPSIDPADAVQFTVVLFVLVTLAEKFAVWEGQPALLGYKLANVGLTVTATGG